MSLDRLITLLFGSFVQCFGKMYGVKALAILTCLLAISNGFQVIEMKNSHSEGVHQNGKVALKCITNEPYASNT